MNELAVDDAKSEWHLRFSTYHEDEEAFKEAELRYQYILKHLQEDLHVAEVEVSDNHEEPQSHVLIVRFRPGKTKPADKHLHNLNQIHADTPIVRRSRYERLMADDEDLFDES